MCIQGPPRIYAKHAATALLRDVHLYERLADLNSVVANFLQGSIVEAELWLLAVSNINDLLLEIVALSASKDTLPTAVTDSMLLPLARRSFRNVTMSDLSSRVYTQLVECRTLQCLAIALSVSVTTRLTLSKPIVSILTALLGCRSGVLLLG